MNLEEKYLDYLKKYDDNIPMIKLKKAHSLRVAKLAQLIMKDYNLSVEEEEAVYVAAILHDIGRFKQVITHNTFLDKISFDHGDYGASLLFNENVISLFYSNEKYYSAIKKAIINHNKKEITYENEFEKIMSNIIRDADKVDILYLQAIVDIKYQVTEPFTPVVKSNFINKKLIDVKDVKNETDRWLLLVSFADHLVSKTSRQIVKDNKYLEKIISNCQSEYIDFLRRDNNGL